MSKLASRAFLNHLKSLYPVRQGTTDSDIANPWYIPASVAFAASNRPEGVPRIFQHVLEEIQNDININPQHNAPMLLAQRMREAIFKSGLTGGYSKAINALLALQEVMPEHLWETRIHRDTTASLADLEKTGLDVFETLYGNTADSVRQMIHTSSPDMWYFSQAIGYGLVYGPTEILSPVETSYAIVAALISVDTPKQIQWHLSGALRGGATVEEVQAVRNISMEVANRCGVTWRDGVPEVDLTVSSTH